MSEVISRARRDNDLTLRNQEYMQSQPKIEVPGLWFDCANRHCPEGIYHQADDMWLYLPERNKVTAEWYCGRCYPSNKAKKDVSLLSWIEANPQKFIKEYLDD